jgi:pimeloyl-ACP methyl ester carboxylesterase
VKHRRVNVQVPLTAEGLPAGRLFMAATLHLPDPIQAGAPVLFMFPGAGFGRGYFDIQQTGFDGYSEAAHHVAQGIVVVAMDHLGVGDSSLPEDRDLLFPVGGDAARFQSGGKFSLQMMAAACHAGARAVMAGLREGTLHSQVPRVAVGAAVGVGQSMGGHIVVIAQGNHGTFDAIAILGSSFTQTRLALLPGRRYPVRNAAPDVVVRAAQTESDMTVAFHWPEEPPALVAADMDPAGTAPWRSRAIPSCAGDLLAAYAVAREAGAVRVPVFLVYGEIDVTPEPLADAAMFRSTCDLALLIVPRMAHMHNFAPTRLTLWQRTRDFVHRIARDAASR